MKVDKAKTMTPAEVRAAAQAWYERQLQVAAMALGPSWPRHREWVDNYLRAELRERLIALGWRPRHE